MVDFGATYNFITEAEARRLRLRWEKDSERMKTVNSVALPIVRLVKWMMMKLEGWKGPVDFVVVKMDDFDVVLGMEFLLEHQVIPMPSAKCLVITGSFSTVVQVDICQPNRFLTRASSLTELLKEDIQWGENSECQAAFDGLKQAMIEGPILGVADATKPFKVETERFICMLEEYLDSPTRRSQFKIDGRRHFVLSSLVDRPYVGNNPQFHKFVKEWEQMADIARACLEKASRQIEKRADQKRCPFEF
ncbi:hypothetical protein E5676_scaffold172G00580 [Cucumis melo var. makuwa]|uniref:Asp_protease_2 domain-containing protein n=1 Tax=Cucumis melo var. makuwa TaxID=1194695 RepID=A0A5D3E6G4_CUCMM|nr:hypothetical protein E6C27_scaffold43G00770 [Cucumis melo var. makuwa]TYK31564.1 hypothetical protein E5676_scaffold172G00580 [Cucumis melo var. makuwa]